MQREAYFNFTRLCSNLFYIMMLVFREGGGWTGDVFVLMHSGVLCCCLHSLRHTREKENDMYKLSLVHPVSQFFSVSAHL